MTNKRKPRLKDIYTAEGKHSAMTAWAQSHKWKVCVITAEFKDGSKGEFKYEQATREVEYKVEGETYSVSVPIMAKFVYDTKDDTKNLGPLAILEAETKFMGPELAKISVHCEDQ